jgi:hypothetical protein
MMLRHYLITGVHFGLHGIEKWNLCFLIPNLQMEVGLKRVGEKLQAKVGKMLKYIEQHFALSCLKFITVTFIDHFYFFA